MLKINKILSKKIKFPLSLREAKQRSNLSGFSLIELMVAVAILAMAIFGIFHAYSAGFMGMADARDRTVATNYAREAMEDIKNMEFELITNENLSAEVIFDGEFKRNVIVSDLEDNLKKVTTRVYWTKRDGDLIDVTTSMMINQMQFNPGVADHILLFSEKYELTIGGTTVITAIIKDANGNTKIDWDEDKDISFSITTGKGEIDPTISDTIKGVATTNYTASDFTIEELPTTATITASVDGLTSTLTLNITEEVTKIELSASQETIWADYSGDDGLYESTVTAKLLDAKDDIVTDATNIITFAISGEGNFVDDSGNILSNLITITPINGSASIKVKSIENTPGAIIVTASSEGLVSDSITIISLGDPTSISVSIYVSDYRNYIYNDGEDSAKVIVNILDQKSNSIPFTGEITLQGILDTESVGSFNPSTLEFIDEELLETTFTCTEAGIVAITAYGDGLTPGSSTIVVSSSFVANSISLSANPSSIPAGGTINDASIITATVKSGAYIVENYKNDITFTIDTDTSSTFYEGPTPLTLEGSDYGNDGVAEVKVIPATTAGTAIITVTTSFFDGVEDRVLTDSIDIAFFVYPHHIKLSSDPQNIQVGNKKFEVKAIMMDENNVQISNYNESVTFDIFFGFPSIIKYQISNTKNLTTTFSGGEVIIDMKSVNEAGTATLDADSGGILGTLNIPVGITLQLANPPITYENNQVSFDIEVLGAPLTLDEMKVSWSPNGLEALNKIEIEGIVIYNDGLVYPDPVGFFVYTDDFDMDIRTADIDVAIDTTLLTGESTITMYFSTDMSGKNILDVTFNPNSGDYTVNLK